MALEFLLRNHARTGDPLSKQMLDATCVAMARGGLYDQLGGGFARYSVDAGWVVPHFEKMLYDNAQLLGLYARWGGHRVAGDSADFLLRELRTAEGGFASALDADTEGAHHSRLGGPASTRIASSPERTSHAHVGTASVSMPVCPKRRSATSTSIVPRRNGTTSIIARPYQRSADCSQSW
jgi:hypothetical protein